MNQISRRSLLRGGAGVAVGAVAVGGPFQGFLAMAQSSNGHTLDFRTLRPIADLRDGIVRLWLPEGFQYRSFHDTEFSVVLDDGTGCQAATTAWPLSRDRTET